MTTCLQVLLPTVVFPVMATPLPYGNQRIFAVEGSDVLNEIISFEKLPFF